MQTVNQQSKTSVYFGVNFVIAAPWAPDKSQMVDFQKALLDNGLDFSQTNMQGNNFILVRQQPSPLQVRLEANGPQVSSIHVFAQNPTCDLDMFIRDAVAVCGAYQQTWTAPQYQLIRRAVKIQHLYSCQDHAFKYIWENRLGQSPDDFRSLGGRPVAGGGLRLVMPPHAQQGMEPRSAEIRIESFLREQRQLFVETSFVFPQPVVLKGDQTFEPGELLQNLEQYASNEVWDFLTLNMDAQQ